MIKDDLLDQQMSAGQNSNSTLYADGLSLCGISSEIIFELGIFINSIYERRSHKRNIQVTRNALTMLRGAMVALGTRDLSNPEWKEHCASSLREIFHEWDAAGNFQSDYGYLYIQNRRGLTDYENKLILRLKNRYSYFSGIVHHSADKIMRPLCILKNNEALKLEDCYLDVVFIGQVCDILIDFSKLKKMIKEL